MTERRRGGGGRRRPPAAEAYPRIVAALIRVTGDWTLAEDCAQEALAPPLERWPRDGVPANPGGWLMTVARNRAIDVLRRATVERRKLRELAVLADPQPIRDDAGGGVVDDRLRLVFTCCHPALALEARVALTLRTVAGVPTADIARAFLVSEATMTRRITRAKARIAAAGIPYRVPTGPALAERLPGVLAVLYLLFTRGYDADGEPAFADEAVRLARLLTGLMPDQPEVAALLRAVALPALPPGRPPRRRRQPAHPGPAGPFPVGPRRHRRGPVGPGPRRAPVGTGPRRPSLDHGPGREPASHGPRRPPLGPAHISTAPRKRPAPTGPARICSRRGSPPAMPPRRTPTVPTGRPSPAGTTNCPVCGPPR